MHRQSLGSPGPKIHGHGEDLMAEDQKQNDQECSLTDADEDKDKSQKSHKSPPRPERYVHVIPLLTVLCFLILYLSSHDPSPRDLAQFNGFRRPSKTKDLAEIDDFKPFLDIQKGDVLAIRSLRNLQEIGKHGRKYRLHRKIGDF